MSLPRLLLATGNAGKVREIRAALRGAGVELVALDRDELGGPVPPEPEENAESFLANAGLKALHYAAATGLPALAEDSGLEVDALGGEPGVRSARWLGRDTPYSEKNRRLLELVAERAPGTAAGRDDGREAAKQDGREARYRSACAVAAAGRILFRSTGVVEGRIARAPRGTGGFGYDPVFELPESGRTMAELTLEEKERISHRGRALAPVREFLRAALAAEPSIIPGGRWGKARGEREA